MRQRQHLTLLAIATALVLALALVVILSRSASPGRSSSPAGRPAAGRSSGFDGAALEGLVPAPDFTLRDMSGRRVSLVRYRGEVTVIAFSSATCGATCVLVAQQMRGALDELPSPVPVLIVSTRPSGDTRARVAQFLSQVSLGGRVRYLSGPESRLRAVWRAYHVTVAGRGRAAAERSATVILVDRSGHERVLFGLEQLTPEALAHDIGRLQAG